MQFMRSLSYSFLFLFILFISASCSNKQYQALFSQKSALADTSSQKIGVTLDDYRIKSQDVLQIRNLQNIKYIVDVTPVNTTTTAGGGGISQDGITYQVEEDSTVALPVIGHVKVVGLKRIEAQKLIESIYRKDLLVNPIIDLKIINLKVIILGEIRVQGNYPLVKDKTTLIEAIGAAGGLTERADEKTVKIIRGSQRNPTVISVNLNDIGSINNPKTILQSGDIIYIAQNNRAVRTDNLQSVSIFFQPVLILLNTALIIFTLIRR